MRTATVAGVAGSPVLTSPRMAASIADLVVKICEGNHSDALSALVGAAIMLMGASADTDDLARIVTSAIEMGRAQVATNRAAAATTQPIGVLS